MNITSGIVGDAFKPKPVPLFLIRKNDVELTVQALARIESEDETYEGVFQSDTIAGCASMAEELALGLGCELVRLEFEKL